MEMDKDKDKDKEAQLKAQAKVEAVKAATDELMAPPKTNGDKKAATFHKGELGFAILVKIDNDLGMRLSQVTEMILAHALDVKTVDDVGKLQIGDLQKAVGIV